MTKPQGSKTAASSNPAIWRFPLLALAALLFFCRFFIPPEAAVQGDSLWVVCLWFVCSLLWAIGIARGAFPPPRLDALDACAALWIGCQIASAVSVIASGGDKRAAANLGWEWAGLGVVWLISRHAVRAAGVENAFLRGVVVTGVVLSGYGLYQHYVAHPRLIAEYGPLFDQLRAGGANAAAVARRFAEEGIPTEGPALTLYEKRLRDSHEPVALFALANTLGGCLAACLILAAAQWSALRRQPSRKLAEAAMAAAGVVIGWALLLTKSRTAWIGCAIGLAVLFGVSGRTTRWRRYLASAGLAAGLLLIAAGLVFALGGLDRQVLSEAPRSLAFRLQYWQATRPLIANHPWLGVGPGNFRQHYLKHKLPEASEEIADPHNLFFETAATGGLFSLLGLLGFLGLGCWRAGALLRDMPGSLRPFPADSHRAAANLVYWISGAAPVVAFLGSLFCWGIWEDRLLILAMAWWAVAWLLSRRSPVETVDHESSLRGPLAAVVALTIHLLGAGGIGMPGVSQVLLLLVAFAAGSQKESAATVIRRSLLGQPAVAAGLLGMTSLALLVLATTMMWPVLKCRQLMQNADSVAWSTPSVALDVYLSAAKADPWSVDPWRHHFEWTRSQSAVGNWSNESFEAAVKDLEEILSRDPANFWAPRTLGKIWLDRFQGTQDPEDVQQAILWLSQARVCYPTNSLILADLAMAFAVSGDRGQSVEVARSALNQDDIYHRQGHVDRYLDPIVREKLESFVTGESGNP